ncbi:hypothetical protein JCM3766R1_002612 [Sporobolomyces carnicolor]
MLRISARNNLRAITTSSRLTRAESTSVPPSKAPPPPSSRNAPTDQTTAQASSNTVATPQVESPSPDKNKKVRSPTDPAADYQRLLEERFGGGEAAALGELVDGKPQGMAKHVKNNLFRLI